MKSTAMILALLALTLVSCKAHESTKPNAKGDGMQAVTTNQSGNIFAAANLVLTPATVNFGSIPSGTASGVILRVDNFGDAPTEALSFSGLTQPFALAGGVFPGSGGSCPGSVIPPGGHCTFGLSFSAPQQPGMHSLTVQLVFAPGQSLPIPLSGYSTGPGVTPGPGPSPIPTVPTTPSSGCTVAAGPWGNNGIVYESIFSGYHAEAVRIAQQCDGKVIVVGQTAGCPGQGAARTCGAVVRYLPGGQLDGGFGVGGKLHLPVGISNRDGSARSVAVQTDGKIVVASRSFNPATNRKVFTVHRLLSDGASDSTFGGGTGKVHVPSFHATQGDTLTAMTLQADGKIILVGEAYGPTGNRNFAVVRLLPNGALDNTFGPQLNGMVRIVVTKDPDFDTDVAVQADGRIVVSGRARLASVNGNSGFDMTLVRLNPDGQLDSSFGAGGIAGADVHNRHDGANAVEVLPNGDILTAGFGWVTSASRYDWALALFNTWGALVPGFGGSNDGIARTAISNRYDSALDVAVDGYGKILAGGTTRTTSSRTDGALVRYHENGYRDTSFSSDGILRLDLSQGNNPTEIRSVVIQPDGKALATGKCYLNSRWVMCTVRTKAQFSYDSDALDRP